MLNRTNRTLSANLNRLNLGTRTLAVLANLNMDAQTLRIRHVHPQAEGVQLRPGRPGSFGCSIVEKSKPKPATAGSSPQAIAYPMERDCMSRPDVVAEAPPVWTDLVDWPVVQPTRPSSSDRSRLVLSPASSVRRLADRSRLRVLSGG